jgi:hypothetical protein
MSFQPSTERLPGVVRPSLRLLRGGRRDGGARDGVNHSHALPAAEHTRREVEQNGETVAQLSAGARSRILVAGADPARRATVLRNLSEALPEETQFGEAEAAWEVLEQAPSSGVVMLAGDLDEATAESVMNVLGHRYPSLPVVALGLAGDRQGASAAVPRR